MFRALIALPVGAKVPIFDVVLSDFSNEHMVRVLLASVVNADAV